jgi:membrane protease subunit HflK
MTSTWPERRALTVSLVGLVFQIALVVFLCVVFLWNGSEATRGAALLAISGLPIWLFLSLIFKQRAMVREETLEAEQLQQERQATGGTEALFGAEAEELMLARRRLRWMFRWMLPAFSLLTIGLLAWLAWRGGWSWSFGQGLYAREWPKPAHAQLSFAFLLGAAFLAFLLSRYATGMARQAEWRMLRAGAAFLMGNTLVCAATAICVGLVHFDVPVPERVLAYVVRILMLVLAVEMLLNFVLDLYRPRQPGEEPRPAFDSRLLALFCEPGGIARSIAETLNYQFGFEVSSTWFYKLLERTTAPILLFGVVVMFAASMIVIVNVGEQVVIERLGRPLQTGAPRPQAADAAARFYALAPGLHWKLPWPIERVYRYPANQVLHTVVGETNVPPAQRGERLGDALLWSEKHEWVPHVTMMVATEEDVSPATQPAGAEAGRERSGRSVAVSLIRMSMPIQYRIKDLKAWREEFMDPARMLREIAYQELTKYAAGVDVDMVMGAHRTQIATDLRRLIQARADALGLGIQIVTLGMQSVHPPENLGKDFEAVVGAESKKRAAIRTAESERNRLLSEVCGSVSRAEQLASAIATVGNETAGPAEKAAARDLIEDLFVGNPAKGVQPIKGTAAQVVAEARAEMWQRINQARADADTVLLELPVYRAAPRIYSQRRYLEVLAEGLVGIRKYLVAADVEPLYQMLLNDPTVSAVGLALEGEEKGQTSGP